MKFVGIHAKQQSLGYQWTRTSRTKAAKDIQCIKVWQNVLSLVPTCENSSGCPISLPCQHSSMIVTVLLFFPDLQPSPYSTNRSPPLSYNTVLLTRPARQPTITFRNHMYTYLHTQSHTYRHIYIHKYTHTYIHACIHTYFMHIHYIHVYVT